MRHWNRWLALLIVTFFSSEITFLQQQDAKQFQQNEYRSACSDALPGETVAVDLGKNSEGILTSQGHQDSSIPLSCTWRVFQNENVYGSNWAVELKFEEFALPEDTSDDDSWESLPDFTTYSDLLHSRKACERNFVRIAYEDDVDTSLGIYCGTGWVPEFHGQYRRPVIIQVNVEKPLIGFKIRFQRATWETRIDLSKTTCSSSYFQCRGSSGRCVPEAFRCDDQRDCPSGEDETNCATENSNRKPVIFEGDSESSTPLIDSGCGSARYQTGTSGHFHTTGYPCQYPNNARCLWYINADHGKDIVVGFNSIFGLESGTGALSDECPFDGITFYALNSTDDSQSTGLTFLSRFCGKTAPKKFLVHSHSLIVLFESDAARQDIGFRLSWAALDQEAAHRLLEGDRHHSLPKPSPSNLLTTDQPACMFSEGVTLTRLHGVIRSPGGISNYPPSAYCRWLIRPSLQPGQKVSYFELHFYDFVVQASKDCNADALHVRYVDMRRKVVDVAFCDSNKPSIGEAVVIRPNTPELELIFQSDLTVEERGFQLGYVIVAKAVNKTTKQPKPSRPRSCGQSFVEPPAISVVKPSSPFRIVGGQVAKPGAWPFAVELVWHDNHICGATIINNRWLLTAAHCFKNERHQKRGWEAVVGRHSVYSQVAWDRHSQVQRVPIQNILTHAKFGKASGSKEYDIALVQLEQPIILGRIASTACLPSHNTLDSDRCFVVGWGETKGTGGEGLLKQSYMPVLPNHMCRGMNLYYYALLTNSMICAGYESGESDSCQGDSGGPLLCIGNDQRWEVHGIVSFGKGCAGWRAPGIYTRVYSHLAMIRRVVAAFS